MPLQKLPILILVSEERNTGKTTFLNLLKAIFQDNTTFNTNEDFRSKFNADWGGKLLIMVDEVLLSRREDSERLKLHSASSIHQNFAGSRFAVVARHPRMRRAGTGLPVVKTFKV